MAVNAQGAKIYWSETTPGTTSTQIAECLSFSGPGMKTAVIDVTNLQSTGKEKLIGLYDAGQLTLDLNFVATGDVGQKSLRSSLASRVKGGCIIQISTVTTTQKWRFEGYVSGFSVSGGVDTPIKANAVIEISGGVTWGT